MATRTLPPCLASVLLMIACAADKGGAPNPSVDAGLPDLPIVDGGVGSGTPIDAGLDVALEAGGVDGAFAGDCVRNPRTHLEIINRCTPDVRTRVSKTPALGLLLPDGGLPGFK